MASAAARERYARKNEQDELERAFRTIDKKGDDKIDADELNQLFLALGHKVTSAHLRLFNMLRDKSLFSYHKPCDGVYPARQNEGKWRT